MGDRDVAVKNSKKSKALGGVKALVVTASVAATLAGWAMLPANDPQGTVAADQQSNVPAQSVPDTSQSRSNDRVPQSLGSLPQAQVPQSSQNRPSPFTRSRSSR